MRAWPLALWDEDVPIERSARDAVWEGYAVVFLRPGGKEPICPLTARELKLAGVDHPCGVAHASTDEKWVMTAGARLRKKYGRLNLGIAAHASRVVVIDADTPEQVESVREWFRQMGEDAIVYGLNPTVSTPGVERDGVWVHHGGTHWYFNVTVGVDLPVYPGELRLPGGAVMRWNNSYTVVPPSVRVEGRYTSLTDNIPDLPFGALALIRHQVDRRVEWAQRVLRERPGDALIAWSVMTPWPALLEAHGWQSFGKLDRQCNCPVWRRPGDGQTSDRSAIAHENDCTIRENFEGHGSLHVFSDNVPGPVGDAVAFGQRDFTKLQFVALMDHDGNETDAQIALGLGSTAAEQAWMEGLAGPSPRIPTLDIHVPGDPSEQGFRETAGIRSGEPIWRPDLEPKKRARAMQRADRFDDDKLAKEYNEWRETGAGKGFVFVKVSDISSTPTEATIGRRADGKFTLYPSRVNSIFGPSDSGKSWYGLGMCHDVNVLGHEAMYIDIEDDEQGIKGRSDLLSYDGSGLTYVRPYAGLDRELKEAILQTAKRCKLIVVDSLDALLAMMQLDGNSNVAVRTAGNLLKQWAFVGGAAVLVVDHATEKLQAGEKALTAIGSSAKKALIDGVMLRADRESLWLPGTVCSTMVMVGKDRHGAVKQHAYFANNQSTYGRLTRMQMTPGIDGQVAPALRFLVPPTYDEVPDDITLTKDEQQALDQLLIVELKKGWATRTKLCTLAGDKNGRRGIGRAVDQFLLDYDLGLDKREAGLAGRTWTEYHVPTEGS